MEWEYGGVYKTLDMDGIIVLPNNSMLKVCDLTKEMPEFMKEADTLFIDPPWNTGNLNSFYYKYNKSKSGMDFLRFTGHLFKRIDEIKPKYLFIEMGKEYLSYYIEQIKLRFKYVTFYNSMYYNKPKNKCYVIHATDIYKKRRYKELEDLDEEEIIKWICANHEYDCIGDLCMGRGLVGKYAYENSKRFVGTELNHKRLAVLVDLICNKEKV